jgi:predicted nucleic acid-binding protein
MNGLLDTSVFVAWQTRRPLGALPDLEYAVSSITMHELWIGVHRARNAEIRANRISTVSRAEAAFEALAVDLKVARAAARLRTNDDRVPALSPLDALIAGTALARGLVLVTQDRDYLSRPELSVVLI